MNRIDKSKLAPERKKRLRIALAIIILIIAFAILSAAILLNSRSESDGLTVEFTARMLDNGNRENYLLAGKEALLTFKLKDNRTGEPISALDPEIGFYVPGEHDETREHKHFEGYHLTGELNMAKLQLFVLNSERGTIEVLDTFGNYDPRPQSIKAMGSMTSKVIRLKGSPRQRVEDLVSGRYGDYIYASLPGENQVAVVNTLSHEVIKYIDAGTMPGRMFLQPESKFLWVSSEGGISIIDTESNTLAKTLETGKGYHQVAFSSEFAFVTNSQSNTVSVVRLGDLKKLDDIKVQRLPYNIDYSSASNQVYVANTLSGTLTVIDAATKNIKKHVPLSMGIEVIKFSPDGRRGVVLDKHANTAYIIEAADSSVIKVVKTGEAPDAVAFMEDYVLVRNTYSNDVTYISMTNPDISSNELVGSQPPLNATLRSIQITPYGDEAIITSPRDTRIFFMHSMNGQPMVMNSATVEFGSDSVALVENKIHETDPGIYQQYIIPDREGTYIVEFRTRNNTPYLNTGINATFKIEVLPDMTSGPRITALFTRTQKPGIPSTLQYSITDGKTDQPVENLTDLTYLVVKPSSAKGTWTRRLPSKNMGSGIYEAIMTFSEEGEYMVTLTSDKLSSMGYRTMYDYVTVRNSTI